MCLPSGGSHFGCGIDGGDGTFIEMKSDGTQVFTAASGISSNISTSGGSVKYENGILYVIGAGGQKIQIGGGQGIKVESQTSKVEIGGGSGIKVEDGTSNVQVGGGAGIQISTPQESISIAGSELRARLLENANISITVNGEEVLAVGKDGEFEVTSRLGTTSVKTLGELRAYVNRLILNDPNISNVTIGTSTVSLNYTRPARLFWVVPMSLTPTISVNVGTTSSEAVTVNYPWYGAFFSGKISSEAIANQVNITSSTNLPGGATGATVAAVVLDGVSKILTAPAVQGSASSEDVAGLNLAAGILKWVSNLLGGGN